MLCKLVQNFCAAELDLDMSEALTRTSIVGMVLTPYAYNQTALSMICSQLMLVMAMTIGTIVYRAVEITERRCCSAGYTVEIQCVRPLMLDDKSPANDICGCWFHVASCGFWIYDPEVVKPPAGCDGRDGELVGQWKPSAAHNPPNRSVNGHHSQNPSDCCGLPWLRLAAMHTLQCPAASR